MAKGTLILLRHGQTFDNVDMVMSGQHDVALTPEGEEQARAAGRALAGFRIDKVYSSSLRRAFNTASLALATSGHAHLDIEARADLKEVDSGRFTGLSLSAPEIRNFKRDYETPLPGGESDKTVVERVQKFYTENVLPRLESGETVLVVAHAGVLHAFDVALGLRVPDPQKGLWGSGKRINNAQPTVVEYTDGVMTGHYNIENKVGVPPANANIEPPKPPKAAGGKPSI